MNSMKRWYLGVLAPALIVVGCGGANDAAITGGATQEQVGAKEAAATIATFSGTVRDSRNEFVSGAQVTINGITRLTDTSGKYSVSVTSAASYTLSVSKVGYAPLSDIVTAPVLNNLHVLRAGTTFQVDAARDATLTDQQTGVTVNLRANTLVNSRGELATGLVRITLASYGPLAMPGDYTAVNADGKQVALESVGAFFIGAVDANNGQLNLGTGAAADVSIPVPKVAGGAQPRCVIDGTCRLAMWRFNTTTGKWYEQRASNLKPTSTSTTFTMIGGQFFNGTGGSFTTNGGLGIWNADLEKTAPACTIVNFVNIPLECYNPVFATPEPGITLNAQLPNSSNVLVPKSNRVDSNTAFVILYNIGADKEQEVGITFAPGAPSFCAEKLKITSSPAPAAGYPVVSATGGNTRFNSGAPWGGTGYPTNSLGTPVTFDDVAKGDQPCGSQVWFEVTPG